MKPTSGGPEGGPGGMFFADFFLALSQEETREAFVGICYDFVVDFGSRLEVILRYDFRVNNFHALGGGRRHGRGPWRRIILQSLQKSMH